MNELEVARLLAFANGLDQRHGIDDVKVQAWYAAFAQEAPTITYSFAQTFASRHYATDEKGMLTPAHLVKGWREHQRMVSDREYVTEGDAHCGRRTCECTHTGPCFKGWIDGVHEHATSPCRVCRPTLAAALDSVAPLGYRSQHDQTVIRSHASAALVGER